MNFKKLDSKNDKKLKKSPLKAMKIFSYNKEVIAISKKHFPIFPHSINVGRVQHQVQVLPLNREERVSDKPQNN